MYSLFGRTGKRFLKALGDFAEGRRFKLQQKDRLFVQLFSKFLKQRVPFEIRALDKHNAVIFTDGPCGLSGVFFFQNGN